MAPGPLGCSLTSAVRLPRVELSTERNTVKFRALHLSEVLGARGAVLRKKSGSGSVAQSGGSPGEDGQPMLATRVYIRWCVCVCVNICVHVWVLDI